MFLLSSPSSATFDCRRGVGMVQRVSTVAFEGIEARAVDVQVQVAPGLPAFTIVGLPDKAVSEARERVRAALVASGLALPARRITVNLAPADLPKEGSYLGFRWFADLCGHLRSPLLMACFRLRFLPSLCYDLRQAVC